MKRKLSVVARHDCHVSEPGSMAIQGNPAEYVGRQLNSETGKYEVVDHVAEYELDTRDGKRVRKLVSRGELLPHDRETATLCGVEFTPLTFDGQRWVAQSE